MFLKRENVFISASGIVCRDRAREKSGIRHLELIEYQRDPLKKKSK